MCSVLMYVHVICKFLICFALFVAAVLTHKPKDVMLGTVKIPLADLIYKRTGTLHQVTAGSDRVSD